jgi:carbonyl reductase 1
MNFSRVAVVTGANKGIGFHIAQQLACEGGFSVVILACRDEKRGIAAVEQIKKMSPTNLCNLEFKKLVIGDRDSHEHFAHVIEETYGKVDVLVNNAAIAFKNSDSTPFKDQCKPTLDINFRGTFDFTELMLPLIRKGSDARIINVASMAGRLSQLSPELQAKFSNSNLTKEELLRLVDQFEADVNEGVHSAKGWGNSNYGFSKLALIAATKLCVIVVTTVK